MITRRFDIPYDVELLIDILEENGFEAYLVGGSIRDYLLEKIPDDWDVATNALPDEIERCFKNYRTIPTGAQHGTLTVIVGETLVEVTSYRADGGYADRRHPDKVEFGVQLKEDMARRDFTINAIAYNPKTGFVDLFGGVEDAYGGIIRAVGNPNERFEEDSLRILRGLRFACQLDFQIESATKAAIHNKLDNLDYISVERIQQELNKAVMGKNFKKVFLEFKNVLTKIIPELQPAVGFSQNSRYHYEDVYDHILTTVDHCDQDLILKLTMLLHDIGKPFSYQDEGTVARHFYNHARVSGAIAEKFLIRLKYSKEIKDRVIILVAYHDVDLIPEPKSLKRLLNRLGEEMTKKLIQVQRADAMSKVSVFGEEKLASLEKVSKTVERILRKGECFSLKQLAINGNDLLKQGETQGKEIGCKLESLLEMVIDGKVENKREELLNAAKNF